MIFYTPQYNNRRIDYGRTIHTALPLPPTAGNDCLWEMTVIPVPGRKIKKRMHSCMERKIKGVRYKVYSAFEGDACFRQLYEKCLASRLLKLHRQGCAKTAAGD